MGRMLWNGNIETALKYTDPRLVSNAGGKAEFTSNMKSTLAVMKAEGITFRGVELGEVSKYTKLDLNSIALSPNKFP
jgi:hypothetical protein